MSVYSNVSATNLLNDANRALTELESHKLDSIISILNNKSYLDSSASGVVYKALNKVNTSTNIKGSIAVLKKNLQALVKACGYIKEIQDLEDQIDSLEQRKYKTVRETHTSVDANGVEHTSVTTRRVIDQGVVNRIRNAERRIYELENSINNAIS